MVKGSGECDSSSFSASKGGGREKMAGRSGSLREGRNLPYGKVRDDGSRRIGFREPDAAVKFAGRAESHGILVVGVECMVL